MKAISLVTVRRHLLRKHALGASESSVPAAVERLVGLRGAEGSTPYLSLFWRVQGFRPNDFDQAVHEHRQLLRVRGPRGTYYWVTPRQVFRFAAAAQSEPVDRYLAGWGMEVGEFQAMREEITGALADGETLPLQQLKGRTSPRLHRPLARKGAGPSHSLNLALEMLQLTGEVTALKEPGFERHRAPVYHGDQRDVTRPNMYGLTRILYPDAVLSGDPVAARRELVSDYIRQYGPVTAADLTWWTGWTKREVAQHLQALSDSLITVAVDPLPGDYYLHRTDDLAEPTDAGTEVQLLPGGDAALKGYTGFARFLHPAAHDQNVLRFMPAVLVDGVGAGNWAYRLSDDAVDLVLELFTAPAEQQIAPLTAAAHRLGAFVAGRPDALVRLQITTRSGPWHARQPFPTVDAD